MSRVNIVESLIPNPLLESRVGRLVRGFRLIVLLSSFLSFFSPSPVAFDLLHSVDSLSLDFVQEIIVAFVEMVDTDVTIFSSASIALAGGIGSDGIERTEVAADTADFVLKDLVVETGFEFTLTG